MHNKRTGVHDGNARDTRQFINGVFGILRTGVPWRVMPPEYGDWKNMHRRFLPVARQGNMGEILEVLAEDTDFEWLMIDASHVKVHPDATDAQGGNQETGRTIVLSIRNEL